MGVAQQIDSKNLAGWAGLPQAALYSMWMGPWRPLATGECGHLPEAPRILYSGAAVSVSGVSALWTGSLEMVSGCAWIEEGLVPPVLTPPPSHPCWPLQLPQDLCPGPFDLIPPKHDRFLSTLTTWLSLEGYITLQLHQKAFHGYRDLRPRGFLTKKETGIRRRVGW